MSPTSPLLLDGRALLDADQLLENGLADRRASFELSFRAAPPHTGFLVIAGIESALAILNGSLIDPATIEPAQRVIGFSDRLAERLYTLTPKIDIDAVPDGTICFPQAPIAALEGPFLEASLLTSILRALLRRATAIATKTTRLHIASAGDPIIDASSAHAPSAEASLFIARAAHIGAASATTNVIASMALGIPFRATPSLILGPKGPSLETTVTDNSWGPHETDLLLDLGQGDDEEATLLEAKRRKISAGGWLAKGLDDPLARSLPLRAELVALEEQGTWASPPKHLINEEAPKPGRKMVARYTNAEGKIIRDMIYLMAERMRSPRDLGAATLTPLAKPRVRGGRTLELPEPPQTGRDRALATRATLPEGITHLRTPKTYPVEESPQVKAQRG